MRFILAPLIVASIAMAVPYYLNTKLYSEIDLLTKNDKELSGSPVIKDSVALIYHSKRGVNKDICDNKCQYLLYNEAVESVLVSHINDFDPKKINDYEVTRFYIEENQGCPIKEGIQKAVQLRISKGQCLMSEGSSLETTDLIYVYEKVRDDRASLRQGLWDTEIDANRKSLIERQTKDGPYEKIYQKTEIKAWPLLYPLMYGGVSGHGLQFYTGFYRYKLTLNNLGYNSPDDKKILSEDAMRLKPLISPETLNTVYQLSKKSDVNVQTLRKWTKEGFIDVTEYSEKGQKLYSDEALERVKLILELQKQGATLKDLKKRFSKKRDVP
ncbi:MAG: MerR family transcriptional regulator [Alphaproteobacteria bacterium]|nr:MerR family transcriptional regulator [Alphaproteobacteria bacterium]